MTSQANIAKYFRTKYGTKLDQSRISRLLRKEELVSASFAFDLADEFPGKNAKQWKNATPDDLKRAFAQLNTKEVA